MVEATQVDATQPHTGRLDDWGGSPIYGDVLFHGPAFQVIRDIEGASEEGIRGTLDGVGRAGWDWDAWHTDVAALDGGLQLALLWARAHLGGASLPMGIGGLHLHVQRPLTGRVQCAVRCRKTSSTRAFADLVFTAADGTPLAELRQVELILRPDVSRPSPRA